MQSVWAKVYIGEDDTRPSVFGIYDFKGNIDQLKEKIKERRRPRLDYLAADELVVYHPGTNACDFNDGSKKYMRLSATPPSDTSEDNPVIVLAPGSEPVRRQEPEDKKRRLQDLLRDDDRDLMRGVKRQLESLHHFGRPTPIETPASLGAKTLDALHKSALVREIVASNDQTQLPVLNQEAFEELATLTNEHQVVAFMTPVFADICRGAEIQVVNSEEYAWLQTMSESKKYNQKPDIIFCHKAIYNSRVPFNTDDENLLQLRRDDNIYGVLASWSLRDSIDVVGEAKMRIDNSAFGEVVNYARHISYQEGSPIHTKLLLYDQQEFLQVRAARGEIASVAKCRWDIAGSLGELARFIREGRSPWVELLIEACSHWGLEVEPNSFLGKGAFGRVFKVYRRPGNHGRRVLAALKLVLPGDDGSGILQLLKEKESMMKAAEQVPHAVAHVEEIKVFGDLGAGLLLSDVGSEVPKAAWLQLFQTLGSLHEHNIIHGDPRLSNSIFVQGQVKWIDFLSAVVATDPTDVEVKRLDLRILVQSCCESDDAVLGPSVEAALKEYAGNVTSAGDVFSTLATPP